MCSRSLRARSSGSRHCRQTIESAGPGGTGAAASGSEGGLRRRCSSGGIPSAQRQAIPRRTGGGAWAGAGAAVSAGTGGGAGAHSAARSSQIMPLRGAPRGRLVMPAALASCSCASFSRLRLSLLSSAVSFRGMRGQRRGDGGGEGGGGEGGGDAGSRAAVSRAAARVRRRDKDSFVGTRFVVG